MSHCFVPINEPFLKYHQPHHQDEDGDDDSIDSDEKDALDRVLDAMFEPRTWFTEGGTRMIQYVSRIPSNRQDAIALQALLDLSLQKYQAKECGLCPIRRSLYDKTFDEVIRQVTVNCIDQGLLLFRIRNEILMTLQAYRTVYESSLKFGLRFALHNQKRSLDLEIEKKGMALQQEDLKRKFFELTKLHEATLGMNISSFF